MAINVNKTAPKFANASSLSVNAAQEGVRPTPQYRGMAQGGVGNSSGAGLGTQTGMQNGTTPGVLGSSGQSSNNNIIANSGWGGAQSTGTLTFNPNGGSVPNVGNNGNMAVNYGGNTYQRPTNQVMGPPSPGGQIMGPPVQSNWSSQTPAGLNGSINNQRYGGGWQPGQPVQSRADLAAYRASQRGGGPVGGSSGANATQWNTDYGPVDTGVDNFRQFGDQYYDHTMSRLQPQMEQRNAQIAQTLINRGLQPGTEAYAAEMARMDSANNDMMSAAALGAEQLGLQAQNQAFGQSMANNQFGLQQANQNYSQQFGYDQLANALNIARQQAAATTGAAATAAAASRYGQDQQNYRAQLANALGYGQLNENARQYDIGNITQNQLMDQNYSLGLMDAYNNYRNTGINEYMAQHTGNMGWLNSISQALGQAPGVGYTGTNTVGPMIGAGQNMASAAANQNSAINGIVGGIASAIPWSDRSVKKNIEPVGQVHGVNLYEFEYKDHMNIEGRYRGVMADEVKDDYPDAVKNVNGIDMVDYRQLPVSMERV